MGLYSDPDNSNYKVSQEIRAAAVEAASRVLSNRSDGHEYIITVAQNIERYIKNGA